MNDLLENVLSVVDELDSIAEGINDQYESMYDWLEGALDIEYTCGSRKNYLGATIAVTLGGPNIYVDTRYGVVRGYWGNESYERSLGDSASRELDSICEEYFDSF